MTPSDRRTFLAALAATSAGTVFLRALAAESGAGPVSAEMIAKAEWIAGLTLTKPQRQLLTETLREQQGGMQQLRAVSLDNALAPALLFAVSTPPPPGRAAAPVVGLPALIRPATDDELAFLSVTELAALLRSRQVSSVELTQLCLSRMQRLDPQLHAVVTRTEELALRQAERADRELAAGGWRGALHGVPYGAKDLLAVPGYPTSWGSGLYRERVRPEEATVIAKLSEAGAVLVAKTSLGELAWGDEWFGGQTRNPWKPSEGSSGSSAGSCAGVAAGFFPFAIGSETWGSIVSPSTRCGTSGLRPTFGAISRHGAMTLAHSLDKLGPVARRVDDLALVHAAIAGADPRDPTARDAGFTWRADLDPRGVRVGVVQELFDADYAAGVDDPAEQARLREWQTLDAQALATLRTLELNLETVSLPADLPIGPLAAIVGAEAASAFDELTRSGLDQQLLRQSRDAWPTVLRAGQLLTAVDYLRAQRIRRLLMERLDALLAQYPVLVAPSFGGDMLLLTNLTGHPQVVVPAGFRQDGTPTSLTFTARAWGEAGLLAVARAYQEASTHHLRRPPGF